MLLKRAYKCNLHFNDAHANRCFNVWGTMHIRTDALTFGEQWSHRQRLMLAQTEAVYNGNKGVELDYLKGKLSCLA